MEPVIENKTEENGRLSFTLSGVNVSIANAIRRIIIAEIPCVVFRTTPHDENKMTMRINTTRMNNELIKQRMSCVPINISDITVPIENYEISIDKKNNSDVIEYVTTEDITINDTATGKQLTDIEVRKIFPPDSLTGDYIDIARLRPRLSADIDGEHLALVSKLDIGTAKENGSFNVVSTCSYGNTENPEIISAKEKQLRSEMKTSGMDDETIEFKIKDWLLLNSQLYSVPNSFDFTIETIGQFTNTDVVLRCIDVMIKKVSKFKSDITKNEDLIEQSDTTLVNGFDIKLISEDYTLGKAMESVLYSSHYDRVSSKSDKTLNFCGFKKPHPHIDESIIRLGFIDSSVNKAFIVSMLVSVCEKLEAVFNSIAKIFEGVD